jgi:hypothetical protein
MPIVFVHGVRTRPGKDWEREGRIRKSLLQGFALKGLVPDPKATYYDEPLWGDLAAAPRWGNASLPRGNDYEAFDLDDDPDAAIAVALIEAGVEPIPGVAKDRQLLQQARRAAAARKAGDEVRRPLEELLDSIFAVAAAASTDEQLAELAEFGTRAAEYARRSPSPSWLADAKSDVHLLNLFVDAVEDEPVAEPLDDAPSEYESFGGDAASRLVEAVRRVGGVSGRMAGRALTAVKRAKAHEASAMFLGDVVVYLNERGTDEEPGKIVSKVGDAIACAHAAKQDPADPRLVVIAHSMGGNIVYDLLTHFRPELEVDVLVTVGSQVAFFEELAQFRSSPTDPPADPANERIKRPDNVKHWINIFDLNDVLGFAASGVYDGVEDYAYSTGEGAIKAHGAYLMLPSFHRRLRKRLHAVW